MLHRIIIVFLTTVVLISTHTSAAVDTDGDGVDDSFDNCINHPNPDQIDSSGDGYGNRCDADLNNDGLVTAADYLILRSKLNTSDKNADLNGDGFITAVDYLILRSMLNQPPGPKGEFSGEVGTFIDSVDSLPTLTSDQLELLPVSTNGNRVLFQIPGLSLELEDVDFSESEAYPDVIFDTPSNGFSANSIVDSGAALPSDPLKIYGRCMHYMVSCFSSPQANSIDSCSRSLSKLGLPLCPSECYDEYRKLRLGLSGNVLPDEEAFDAVYIHAASYEASCFSGLKEMVLNEAP